MQCKEDNEKFNNGAATISFYRNNNTIGGIYCSISFYICEDKNKKIGMIIAEKCKGLVLNTVYSTEKCKFEYEHSKTKEGEERKLTIKCGNSESIKVLFDTMPPIKDYDLEELIEPNSLKDVKDMTTEELFAELCANTEESKQVYRLSAITAFSREAAEKILEKNWNRNAEISKEIISRN